MKFLDRLGLALFSIIVFALSVMLCLILFGWFDFDLVVNALKFLKSNEMITNVSIGVSIALILLAFKCMFFESYTKNEDQSREGILLENDNGKLLVSRDTLENLASSVAKETRGVESVVSKVILDKEKHLIIFVNILVKQNSIIKELSSGLQSRIKQTVKDSLGLDVKEVNIKIKNIASEKKEENIEKQAVKNVQKPMPKPVEKPMPKPQIKPAEKVAEKNSEQPKNSEVKEIKLN